jgi:peroxiredoxin
MLFSAGVWLAVAVFIRVAGPMGAFSPRNAPTLFLATILATIPLNGLTRRIAGLPPRMMTSVVAVASIAPPTLEGVLMGAFPGVYGGDRAMIGQAAVWLLFAIGVAMLLAAVTSLRTRRRLSVGDRAPPIRARSVTGALVETPDRSGGLTHVQFLRFAGCPVCNLHLQGFIRRQAEIRAAGVREVVLFHSDARFINDYHGALPFDLIADPRREIYSRYGIETSPWAILNPMAWPGLIEGYRLREAGDFDSTTLGLPADILVDAEGRIIDCHYGAHAGDQWSVEDVLNRASAHQAAGAGWPGPVVGSAA